MRAGFLWSSIAMGLAAAWLAYAVAELVQRGRADDRLGSSFELDRRRRLRQASGLYRAFEPLVDELSAALRSPRSAAQAKLRHALVAADRPPWNPEEYLALKGVEAVFPLLGMIAFGAASALALGMPLAGGLAIGLMLGLLMAVGYQALTVSDVQSKAARRLRAIKRLLPFAVEMISLTIEAGASFTEAVASFVREKRGHPLADELARVLRDIELGRPRREALKAFQERLRDTDVNELVYSIIEGEELGTPVGRILKDQSARMRLKRSQWVEAEAGKAEVSIVFPGMIVMIACLLIVVTPFALSLLNQDFSALRVR